MFKYLKKIIKLLEKCNNKKKYHLLKKLLDNFKADKFIKLYECCRSNNDDYDYDYDDDFEFFSEIRSCNPKLPENIGNLGGCVIKLELYNYEGKFLPDSICKLINLKEITANECNLVSLPEDIGELINLKYLSLVGNFITELPDSFGKLVSLKYLYISDNEISEIPDSFRYLKSLEELDINGNNISIIPDFLLDLSNLKSVDISDNDITYISENILKAGQFIFQYCLIEDINIGDELLSKYEDLFEQSSNYSPEDQYNMYQYKYC